jgi:hypothetical protein
MNQSLLNYFKEHSKTYSIDVLKNEALKAGNSQTDIDEICKFLKFNSTKSKTTTNDMAQILPFYILPMLTLVISSVLSIYLNLEQVVFSLYLNIILLIVILISYFGLYKTSLNRPKLILYYAFSFVLIPLLGSVLQEGLNIYRFILEFTNSANVFSIEIFKQLSISMLFVFLFYSVILGLYAYKFIFITYLSNRHKMFSLTLGILISLFVLIILIYIRELFNILIIGYFGNLLI